MRQQQGDADMDFAAGGESRDSGNMWPQQNVEIGDALLGKVTGFRRVGRGEDAYDVATFAPAAIKDDGNTTGYAAISVAVSATLKGRITEKDIGATLALIFKGKEKSKAGTYKIFDVHVQDEKKLATVLEKIGAPAEIVALVSPELPF